MDSFNHIPPQPESSATPLPVIRPPVDDGKNAIVDLIDVGLIIGVGVLAYVFSQLTAGIVYAAVHRGIKPQELDKALSHNAWFVLSVELLMYALVVGFMAFLVSVRHRTALGEAIRWNFPTRRRAFYALAAGLGLALFSDIAEIIFARWIPKSLPITQFFQDRSSAFLLAGFGILIAPLVEELLFRGFLYPALSRWTGVAPAVLLTAAGFALLHGAQLAYSPIPVLLIFIVGAVLTIARAISKSVATSVLVHMAYNLTIFLQVFVGSQGFRNLQP